jgi:hypothetical protein
MSGFMCRYLFYFPIKFLRLLGHVSPAALVSVDLALDVDTLK